jgi:hypothetical protein
MRLSIIDRSFASAADRFAPGCLLLGPSVLALACTCTLTSPGVLAPTQPVLAGLFGALLRASITRKMAFPPRS